MFKQLTSKPKKLKDYSKNTGRFFIQRDKFALRQPSLTLIVGTSGKGKTNLLCNLLYDSLKWTRLYVNAKDLSEDKYVTLLEACQNVTNKKQSTDTFYHFTNMPEDIIPVDEMDSKEINLVIFDDFLTDKKADEKISEFCIRGRKKNCTVIYLAQSYYNIPKIVRLQANYLIFFKIDDSREIGNIYQNHNSGLDKKTFVNVFNEATKEPYSFLLLDNVTHDENLKIRKNFHHGFQNSK